MVIEIADFVLLIEISNFFFVTFLLCGYITYDLKRIAEWMKGEKTSKQLFIALTINAILLKKIIPFELYVVTFTSALSL